MGQEGSHPTRRAVAISVLGHLSAVGRQGVANAALCEPCRPPLWELARLVGAAALPASARLLRRAAAAALLRSHLLLEVARPGAGSSGSDSDLAWEAAWEAAILLVQVLSSLLVTLVIHLCSYQSSSTCSHPSLSSSSPPPAPPCPAALIPSCSSTCAHPSFALSYFLLVHVLSNLPPFSGQERPA